MAKTKGELRGRGRGRGLKRPARAQVVDVQDHTDEEPQEAVDVDLASERAESEEPEAVPEVSSPTLKPSEAESKQEESKQEDVEKEDVKQEDDKQESESESSESMEEVPATEPSQYIVDNESQMVLALSVSSVSAYTITGKLAWARGLRCEKTALGQGFCAFASRHRVHVMSCAGGYDLFPAIVLQEPLLQMRIEHGFLLLLCRAGDVKLLDLLQRRCVAMTSLRDICEASQAFDLQVTPVGQLSLHLPESPEHDLLYDSALQLWIEHDGKGSSGLDRCLPAGV